MDNSHTAIIHVVGYEMRQLARVVWRLSSLYDENDWLNDEINIANVIPKSLDEWATDLDAKANELQAVLRTDKCNRCTHQAYDSACDKCQYFNNFK